MVSLNITKGRIHQIRNIPRKVRQARLPWIPLTIMFVLLVCACYATLQAPHDTQKISIIDAKLAP